MTSERQSNGTCFAATTINFSSAKQQYSFGKEARFPGVARIVNHAIGYELPATNAKKACGFGVGVRFKTPMTTRDGTFYAFPTFYFYLIISQIQ